MQNNSVMGVSEQLPPPTAGSALLSLLDHIGGTPGVQHLVDRFVGELQLNPEVAASLAGTDLTTFKQAQVAFFTEAFGGHVPDASVDTRLPCVILEAEAFLGVVLLLNTTLLSLGLSNELHEELVLAVASRALASSAL